MINLMPGEEKRQIRAARTNVLILRYMTIIAIAFGFILVTLAGSYFLLMQAKSTSEALIESNDTKAEAFSATKAEIDSLTASLSGARTILDGEIKYSKVLRTIGQSMPAGTVLKNVTLNDASFNGTTPITVQAYAKNADIAATLQSAFQGTGQFGTVTLGSVSDTDGIDGYPIGTTLTLTLNRTLAL